jgi:hypothetical protein
MTSSSSHPPSNWHILTGKRPAMAPNRRVNCKASANWPSQKLDRQMLYALDLIAGDAGIGADR